jgi:folate-binding protein YgfZ
MPNALEVIRLEDLGIVRVRGVDAVRFLQGQLSNDVARLSAGHSILAGYHNPQGRTIALLRLVQWDADPATPGDILAVVPRELAGVVASRLGKFVLRAKVKVADESAAWRVTGVVDVEPAAVARGTTGAGGTAGAAGTGGAGSPGPRELPSSVSAQTRGDGAVFVRVGDEPARWLVISPADAPDPMSGYAVGDRQTWLRLDIAAGQPQVYAATSEEFVAQMLNLDVLNAIAFDKGCYTGQEVIARAHYRGRVKRRMQRFLSRDACHLSLGDSGQLADGRTFKVVLATQLADGGCEFLAVAPLVGAGHEEAAATVSRAPAAPPAPDATAPPVVTPLVDPTQAPLATATVEPTVAAAAAVASVATVADAHAAPPRATPPATTVADQVSLPYSLPD